MKTNANPIHRPSFLERQSPPARRPRITFDPALRVPEARLRGLGWFLVVLAFLVTLLVAFFIPRTARGDSACKSRCGDTYSSCQVGCKATRDSCVAGCPKKGDAAGYCYNGCLSEAGTCDSGCKSNRDQCKKNCDGGQNLDACEAVWNRKMDCGRASCWRGASAAYWRCAAREAEKTRAAKAWTTARLDP